VTDVDGKPLANQDVVMGVNALTYNKGYYAFLIRILHLMVKLMNIYLL
jgi:hypothetical protein